MTTRIVILLVLFAPWVLPGPIYAEQAQPPDPPVRVRLATSLGNIDLELYPEYAPATVANFLHLVDEGFYQGLIFHRVMANFMVQAGGFDSKMNNREAPHTIVNESSNGLLNRKRYVAMARLDDPDSAGTQFFINVRNNPHLDAKRTAPGYTVFAKVVHGWEVVVKIELSDTGIKAGMPAVPDTPIVIKQITRLDPVAKVSDRKSRTPRAPVGTAATDT